MRAYTVYDFGYESAVLVFAKNAKRAKQLAHPNLEEEWIYLRVNWIRKLPNILKVFDTGEEKCVDNPPSCKECFRWGEELINDVCLSCLEIEA